MFDLGLTGGWAAGGPVADAGALAAKSPAGAVAPPKGDAAAPDGSFLAFIDCFGDPPEPVPAGAGVDDRAIESPDVPTLDAEDAPARDVQRRLATEATFVLVNGSRPEFQISAIATHGHDVEAAPASLDDVDDVDEAGDTETFRPVMSATPVAATPAESTPAVTPAGASATAPPRLPEPPAGSAHASGQRADYARLGEPAPLVAAAEIKMPVPAPTSDMAAETDMPVAATTQPLPPLVRKALADAGHLPVAVPVTDGHAADRPVKVPDGRGEATRLPVDFSHAFSTRRGGAGDREEPQADVSSRGSAARAWGPVARYRAESTAAPAHVPGTGAALTPIAAWSPLDSRAASAAPDVAVASPSLPSTVTAPAPIAPARAGHVRATSADVESLPEGTAQQIVQSLRLVWSRGGGGAHIRLDPRQFGGLSVSVRVDGGQVVAQLQAEKPAVREWLQAHQQTLRHGLAEHDLRLDRLEILGPADEARDETRRDRREQQHDPDDRPARRSRRDEIGGQFEIVA